MNALPTKNHLASLRFAKAVERPPKRQRSSCSYLALDAFEAVMDVAQSGIVSYRGGDYCAAEERFSQALHYVCSLRVKTGSDFGFAASGDTRESSAPASNAHLPSKVAPSSYQEPSIQSSLATSALDKECACNGRIEYDEGMRAYKSVLDVQDSRNTNELVAALCFNTGQTFVERELYDEAIAWFHRSISLLMEHSQKSIWILMNLHSLGYCHYRTGNDVQANIFYTWALSVASSSTSRRSCDPHMHMAASLNCMGVMMLNEESPNTCKILRIFRRSLGFYSARAESDANLVSVAIVLNNIGRCHFLRAEFTEAASVYEECLQIRRGQLDKDSIDLGATLYNLGQTYYELKRFSESLSHYYEVLEIKEKTPGSPPSRETALLHKGIAEIHYKKSNFRMAKYHFSKALELHRVLTDTPGIEVAALLNQMGSLCYKMHDLANAVSYYEEGLQIETTVLSPGHNHIIITLTNIAHIYRQLGDFKKSLVCYNQIYEMQLQKYETADCIALADTMACIGLVQYHLNDHESSFNSYQESLRIRRQHMDGEDHPEIAAILISIGIVLFRQDSFGLAKKCFEESLRIKSKLLGPNHREVATLWYNIATIHLETGEHELAIEAFKNTIRIEKNAAGSNHPDVALTLQHLAQVHQKLGHFEESIQCYNEALEIELVHEELRKPSTRQSRRRTILNLLGNLYLQLGRIDEMMKCYVEACRTHGHFEQTDVESSTLIEVVGYNFYCLSKTHPPSASAA